jgi:hypothetical protein
MGQAEGEITYARRKETAKKRQQQPRHDATLAGHVLILLNMRAGAHSVDVPSIVSCVSQSPRCRPRGVCILSHAK